MKKRLWIALFLVIILVGICSLSAIVYGQEKTGIEPYILASIPKTEFGSEATREDIVNVLFNRWMSRHEIGSKGWQDWLRSYKVTEIKVNSSSDCVVVKAILYSVWPAFISKFWSYQYGRSSLDFNLQKSFILTLEENNDQYVLRGIFSGC